jgi:acyl transferase domain-containing protein/acyl carrier protein
MERSPSYEGLVMSGNFTSGDFAKPSMAVDGSRFETHSAEVIEEWLISKLSTLLGVEPHEIDIREPFASYGMGSTEAVGLSGDLSDWLGKILPADLAYEYPTIETLVRHLTGSPDGPSSSANGLDATPEVQEEPIAIIGIGCRFPGSSGPEAFWKSIRDGVDAITEVPPDRFSVGDLYDPDPSVPGKINSRWGGFVEQVDQFDPQFFGISPREAARMDPQQRLLQEVTWEALEDAGQVPEKIAGSRTGVFVGISNNDYGRIQFSDLHRIDAYAGTGNALSIAANRISYLFDFRGPSIAIDTACSSSLVAIHLACTSLRNQESTLAIAGGVNLILSPAITINFTKAGVMAPDGRCKAFDASANGYVRSEGAGLVVLKPLSRAIADGDPIYAVIRGSAVNQDGRSNGLMAPNPLAQESVLREAYRRANVSPGDVQYVEAHGTGTLLGDPIEAKALGKVLASDRPAGRLCAIGSVKTNIGHCEAAAGIAGLIKVALALKHEEIPASLHFQEPNSHIPFDELPIRVQTRPSPWSEDIGQALAGVSSFGFGGTNAHVVLQQAPQSGSENREAPVSNSSYLLPLSARSPEALHAVARSYQRFLATAEFSLHDVCYSASMRRNHHDYRLAVTGNSSQQLIEGLEAFLGGETRAGLSSGRKASASRRKLVFVFSGQGSQWFGMGRTLLHQEAVFRDSIERCELAFRPHTDWSLIAELGATDAAESRLNEVDVIQPALFAIQVALAALWRSWGIEPQAVVGHSMGEVAAAYVAGALSLEDAALVICTRSRLVKRTIGQGAMASVELSIEGARGAIVGYEDRVSIAVSTSPASTVLSGDPKALAEILEQLQGRDVFGRMVKVDFASHSPQMDPLRGELLQALKEVRPQPASIPFYSTVLDTVGDGPEFDALYWTRNLREPVLFSGSVQRLLEDGYDTFLEISAHPILLSGIQQGLHHSGKEGAVLPSIRREEDEHTIMLRSLGALYSSGYPIDWSRNYSKGGTCVRLPTYPWQRQRCWLETNTDSSYQPEQTQGDSGAKRSLIGRHFKSAESAGAHYWEVRLDKKAWPFLDDHRIEELAAVPASVYVEMILAAALDALGSRSVAINDIEFHRALFLPDGASPTVQMILTPCADGTASFQIYSCSAEAEQSAKSWLLHVSGEVAPQEDSSSLPGAEEESLAEFQLRCSEKVSGHDYYRQLSDNGIQYGPFFQSISQLWLDSKSVLGELRIPATPDAGLDAYQLHPAVLDGCLQVLGAGVASEVKINGRQGIYIPTRIDHIRVHRRPDECFWCRARVLDEDSNGICGDLRLLDEAGQLVIEVMGVHFESLGNGAHSGIEDNLDDWLYEVKWLPKERVAETSSSASPGSWLIFADSGGVGESLQQELEAQGDKVVLVTRGIAYQRTDSRHIRVRPDRPGDLRQLFDSTMVPEQPICRGIVHLWSLDASLGEDATAASIEGAQTLGCIGVLQIVQEMARAQWSQAPLLWLVTRGAQAADEASVQLDLAEAPLWGLGRVIAQEHPTFWGGLVDLEPQSSRHDSAHQLSQEILSRDGEDQLAFRHGHRLVARLSRKQQSSLREAPLRWRSDGSYLITGGLGDLGLSVARWMVAMGARRLILMGRTKLPPRSSWNSLEGGSHLARQVAAIRELEDLGTSLHLASVDVADERQLRAFVEQFHAEGWPPIRGVVHAAGVLQDGLLLQLDAAAMNTVLRPKMVGGWLLHRLLREAPLDFFVVFSSAGSLMGQPGQGNYSAANAFLDALAHHRRAQGLPALSINWGPWAELGFAQTAGGRLLTKRLALLGIRSMPPKRALEVMDRLMREEVTQVVAIPVNWHKYHELYPAGTESALLSQLAHEEAAPLQALHPGEKRNAILHADPAHRVQLLQAYVAEQVARVLGLSAAQLDIQQPLTNLGLDSLMAVELKNRISADLGVNVPMVRFLQGFSVAQAATQLLDQITAEPTGPLDLRPSAQTQERASDIDPADENLLANIDDLSDEQVNSMLTEMLTKDVAT